MQVVPVFPFSLREQVGVAEDKVQYWSSILLSTFGAANLLVSLFSGWLADRIASRQVSLIIGLLFQLAATITFSLASNIYVLLASRALQGVAAANVYCVGLALLVDTVHRDNIGQMMGYVLLGESLGIMLGSLLGGIVYPRVGYPGIVAMMLGCIVVDVVLRLAIVEKKRAAKWVGPVEQSISTEHPSLNAQWSGELESRNEHRRSISRATGRAVIPENLTALPTGAPETVPKFRSCLSKFNFTAPSVFHLLKSPRVLTNVYGVFVCYVLLCCFDSILPIFVKTTFSWNSTGAGLIFLAVTVPSVASPLAGIASDKFGPRWIAASSFIFMACFLVLLRLVTKDTIGHIVLLCGLVTLIGLCITTALSPLAGDLSCAVERLEQERPGIFGRGGAYGQAFGLFNCALAGGMLVGPLWMSTAKLNTGWGLVTWNLGLFGAVAAVPVVFFTGGSIMKKQSKAAAEPEGEMARVDTRRLSGQRLSGHRLSGRWGQ